MARLITSAERITRARALIEQARALPPPVDAGAEWFAYVAQVRDLLRQARDLVKFISYRPGPQTEEKRAAADLLAEAERVQRELAQ